MALLEEEIQSMGDPPIKFSAELLDRKFKLRQLIKIKKYTEAKVVQEEVRALEERELRQIEEANQKALEKQRQNKRKKHRAEYETVKARLEKNINAKLKQRMNEYEKLLLRIQNVHNEMSSKQAREFKKIQTVHAKLLSKYSLNINDVVSRHNQLAEEAEWRESEGDAPHEYQPMVEEVPEYAPAPGYSRPGDHRFDSPSDEYGEEEEHLPVEEERLPVEEERTAQAQFGGPKEVEMEYVRDEHIPGPPTEEGSLRAHVKKASAKHLAEPEDFGEEEADTVPNLRAKVKNAHRKKKAKKKWPTEAEADPGLMDSKDLPNSFNNFYRVETKNFPTESSEESGAEQN